MFITYSDIDNKTYFAIQKHEKQIADQYANDIISNLEMSHLKYLYYKWGKF